MPRRIILHAGFHKTGTTSVQATLRKNRTALKKHIALRLRWHLRDVLAATRGYSTWRDPLSMIKVQHRFEAMLGELPGMPRRSLIISAEELCGHLPGRGDLADYATAPILLYAFWESIRARFPKSEILIYLSTRAPEPWLHSAWAEHVKASNMILDLPDFQKKFHEAADLTGMVAEIASCVPCAVHHSALEDCADLPLGPADPLLDLCDILCIPPISALTAIPCNRCCRSTGLMTVPRPAKPPKRR
jgi:hypothetical protein